MSFLDLFRRKNYASPYYGKGNRALFTAPNRLPAPCDLPAPPQQSQPKKSDAVHTKSEYDGPKWEERRFALVEKLVLQGRLSVILGKTQATDEQIAAKSRHVADAVIKELQTHPYKSHEADRRGEKADE